MIQQIFFKGSDFDSIVQIPVLLISIEFIYSPLSAAKIKYFFEIYKLFSKLLREQRGAGAEQYLIPENTEGEQRGEGARSPL